MFLNYIRGLDAARIILWCYAIWYVEVLVHYFDPAPRIWLTSLGLSLIVGCALLLSTRAAARGASQNRWGVFRLFLMPFCVSSFSALVKGRGFVLIFSPRIEETLIAVAFCLAFCGFVAVLKRMPMSR